MWLIIPGGTLSLSTRKCMASAVHSLNPFRKDSTSCGHCQLLPVIELLVSATAAASADSSWEQLALLEALAAEFTKRGDANAQNTTNTLPLRSPRILSGGAAALGPRRRALRRAAIARRRGRVPLLLEALHRVARVLERRHRRPRRLHLICCMLHLGKVNNPQVGLVPGQAIRRICIVPSIHSITALAVIATSASDEPSIPHLVIATLGPWRVLNIWVSIVTSLFFDWPMLQNYLCL